MNVAQYINQDSGNTEWYTRSAIIEAARATMGSIDLDPASCAAANVRVKARHYYTQDDDGLAQTWSGNVWMNHPYSLRGNPLWINKLVSEYEAGNVKQACCICFAATSERWFHPLFAYPICFRDKREKFIPGAGQKESSLTKGSAIIYLGPHIERFAGNFRDLGFLMIPYQLTAFSGTLCPICEHRFMPQRSDAIYCSGACRQKAKRQRALTVR